MFNFFKKSKRIDGQFPVDPNAKNPFVEGYQPKGETIKDPKPPQGGTGEVKRCKCTPECWRKSY